MSADQGVVVITGGTRGIGAATARRLAAAGQALCLGYRSQHDTAHALAAELAGAGTEVRVVSCDVAIPDDVRALFAAADEMGRVVALVNAAAVLEQQCRMDAVDRARWERVFAVNVFGAAASCAEAVARMSTARGGAGGAIVNVSSRASELGSPNEYVDYAASKAALDTLSRGLALEVAAEGIRVNVVRPGIIDTDMHASGGDPGRAARLGPTQPMGRAGRPAEVAEAIAWLLGPAASFTTGAFLDVSGGR
ncbi:NAD(P)-dependent dehydrogenase (short-subunit alcohol dehydrogenase family) [Nocardioides ginsengisegetis]|uniref:NAD(P)-dependent dehydrogenase (Short-subunit alcohol dehydrogenase family) n=1 Tax=Nocardioides ginsengisegetis TaxID=661491 RepID=A0A7W3IXK5_9ACTN|nr:SDR family oxidoreductase [Nocardioides ginsengisegetis]MBA8802521.1 NAD(P)-dependent dehydrogenase (short-subunit alcohol dehydrogenase family) [Nocardioides ginsengisegetis]